MNNVLKKDKEEKRKARKREKKTCLDYKMEPSRETTERNKILVERAKWAGNNKTIVFKRETKRVLMRRNRYAKRHDNRWKE